MIFPLDEVALKSSDVNSNFPFSNPFLKKRKLLLKLVKIKTVISQPISFQIEQDRLLQDLVL